MDDDLYELLRYADPDTRQAMIDAGLVPQRMGVERQMADMGMGLAQTPTPEGRNVGHTYVASSPLEHLASAVRQGVGAKMSADSMKHQGHLIDQQGAGRLAYLDLLAKAGQRQPQQPAPVQAPEWVGMAGPPRFDGSF